MTRIESRTPGQRLASEEVPRLHVTVLAGDAAEPMNAAGSAGATEATADDMTLYYGVGEEGVADLYRSADACGHGMVSADGSERHGVSLALVSPWPLRRTRLIDLGVPPGPACKGIEARIEVRGRPVRVLLADLRWRDILRPAINRRLGGVLGRFQDIPTVVGGPASFVFACWLAVHFGSDFGGYAAMRVPGGLHLPGDKPAVAGLNVIDMHAGSQQAAMALGKTQTAAIVTP